MSFAVLEPVVRVVIVLCQSASADNRIQICKLGETVFVPLLHVWRRKPADRLKVINCCIVTAVSVHIIKVTAVDNVVSFLH